jgi:hypothetical protein
MGIEYLSHNEINTQQWDNCVNQAMNGNIFAYSWFLDVVADDWDALILNDYQAIMPLPYVEKRNKRYLVNPPFTYQLGIYNTAIHFPEINTEFIRLAQSKFYGIDYKLNNFNNIDYLPNNIISYKFDYQADLIESYDKVSDRYPASLAEILDDQNTKAYKAVTGLTISEVIDFYINNASQLIKTSGNIKTLRQVLELTFAKGFGELYGVYNVFNDLCAVLFFAGSNQKIFLLYCAVLESEMQQNLTLLAIDKFLSVHQEKPVVLCLPTSNNAFWGAGIEYFDLKHCYYPVIQYNNTSAIRTLKTQNS